MWQVRALQAEEQLKQLTAGPVADAGKDASQTRQDAPGDEAAGHVAGGLAAVVAALVAIGDSGGVTQTLLPACDRQ